MALAVTVFGRAGYFIPIQPGLADRAFASGWLRRKTTSEVPSPDHASNGISLSDVGCALSLLIDFSDPSLDDWLKDVESRMAAKQSTDASCFWFSWTPLKD